MELTFQNQTYHYLRNTIRDTRFQEETTDIIVPDSYPDIASIADSSADAVLRGKDCRDGSLTVAGGVKGTILYIPEDQSHPRNLDVYIPFSVKFDHPSMKADSQVICSLRVRSVDAKMINSRKAMLRVNLGCEICAYEGAAEELYELKDVPQELQIKTATYHTVLAQETGEKSFSVNDMLEIPTGKPSVLQIYRFHCRPELTDEKLIGNKAVFKGVLRCRMLYLSDNYRIYNYEENLPFSQYCELHGDYDDENICTHISVTGYDVDQAGLTDGRQIPVSINLLAQCVVSAQRDITVIEDAYTTSGMLQPQWAEVPFDGVLDHQNQLQALRHRLSGELREVLDTQVYWDYPEILRNADHTSIKVPATIRIVGYNNDDILCSLFGKSEIKHELILSENAFCHVIAVPVGEDIAAAEGRETEAKCSVRLCISCFSKEKLKMLCGGAILDANEDGSDIPSVIVRPVEAGVALWDLAKQYGTTVTDIQSANQLSGEVLSENMTWLLPI